MSRREPAACPDQRSFEDLVAEGAAEPVEGWDFSWFAGRATEERPAWGYAKMTAARLAAARAALGAVVYFLRKVLWTVPGFTVQAYQQQLRRMHDQIQADGPFVAHAQRFLIEAGQP